LLADELTYHFGDQATKGGPLGELVQWSDVISTLYLLGHDITIVLNKSPNAALGIKKYVQYLIQSSNRIVALLESNQSDCFSNLIIM